MTEFNYGAVRTADEFEKFAARLIEADRPFGFDIEAGFHGEPKEEKVAVKFRHPNWVFVGFSFTNSEEWARYVPIAHDTGDNVDDPVRVAVALWNLLQTGNCVAHNALYELGGTSRWFRETLGNHPLLGKLVMEKNGFFPVKSDTLIEAFLTAQFPQFSQGLKEVTKIVFGHEMVHFDDLFKDMLERKEITKARLRFNILELTPQVIEYACEDSLWCLKLHNKHLPMLERMPVGNIVYKAEIALLPVVAQMEYEGLLLNWDAISQKAVELANFCDLMNEEIQSELSERLSETININLGSVKQLSEVLFDKLGIIPKEFSEKTGAASTSEKALRAVAREDPVIKRILEYREVTKLLGTYLLKYQNQLNYAGDGHAYPSHKQTGTKTGRFSVDGVSYQQWPKPYHYELDSGEEFDLNFRDLLVSPPGYRIIGFDFSQVELRVLAGAAGETAMIEAFEAGIDIHTATASLMLGIPVEEVQSKDRQVGKTLNFAIVYGSGPETIANLIGCTKDEAKAHLENYFKAFPGIKKFMDDQVAFGKANGYVENLFGRRVKVWEFLDTRKYIIAAGERFCGNAPIQGGAGDYLKIGMVRADKMIREAGLQDKIKMVITFHDALEFYVHESVTTQEFIDLVGPAVSFPLPGYPDIKADWHEGYQWGSLAEISLDDTGKLSGYSIKVELPSKESFKWKGDTLHEALTPYYFWSKNHYGKRYHDLEYYLSIAPEEADYAPAEDEEIEVTEAEMPARAVVTLNQMPTQEGWNKFKQYLRLYPGGTTVTVVTPEGDLALPGEYDLDMEDQGEISRFLGGASLRFADGNLDSLLEGIEL